MVGALGVCLFCQPDSIVNRYVRLGRVGGFILRERDVFKPLRERGERWLLLLEIGGGVGGSYPS